MDLYLSRLEALEGYISGLAGTLGENGEELRAEILGGSELKSWALGEGLAEGSRGEYDLLRLYLGEGSLFFRSSGEISTVYGGEERRKPDRLAAAAAKLENYLSIAPCLAVLHREDSWTGFTGWMGEEGIFSEAEQAFLDGPAIWDAKGFARREEARDWLAAVSRGAENYLAELPHTYRGSFRTTWLN